MKQNHTCRKCAVIGSMILFAAVQSAFANINIATSSSQNLLAHQIDLSSFALSPTAGIVTGFSSGQFAAPYVPGYGNTTDLYLYVAATPTAGRAQLKFAGPQTALSLLWGSVDTYNSLLFYNQGLSVGTVTGSQVSNPANGDQGQNGSVWVTVSGVTFDEIQLTSSGNSFEAMAFSSTPEPGFYGVLALGLGGLFSVVRRRRSA